VKQADTVEHGAEVDLAGRLYEVASLAYEVQGRDRVKAWSAKNETPQTRREEWHSGKLCRRNQIPYRVAELGMERTQQGQQERSEPVLTFCQDPNRIQTRK